jgi:hypothetical protein
MLRRALLLCPIACAALASSAQAATRPTVVPVALPTGPIAGKTLPYTEIGSTITLHVAYAAHLPAGGKLELLAKDPAAAYRVYGGPIHLVGGHAQVKATFNKLGGPVSYEVAVLAHGHQVVVSHPVTVYYAQLPGGVFAELQGDYASFTSRTNAAESCAGSAPTGSLCKGTASSGQGEIVGGFSGTFPVPPGWTVTLVFNGQQVCTSASIEARCEASVTVPTVTSETIVDLTATLTPPHGQPIVATRVITVYP